MLPRLRSIAPWNRALLACSVLAVLGLWSPRAARADDEAAPPNLSGTYEFSGLLADSTTCSGTIEMKTQMSVRLRKGPKFNSYRLKIKFNGGWEGVGVGTFIDGRFYFAMAPEAKYLAVAVFRPVVLSSDMAALKQKLWEKEHGNFDVYPV